MQNIVYRNNVFCVLIAKMQLRYTISNKKKHIQQTPKNTAKQNFNMWFQ